MVPFFSRRPPPPSSCPKAGVLDLRELISFSEEGMASGVAPWFQYLNGLVVGPTTNIFELLCALAARALFGSFMKQLVLWVAAGFDALCVAPVGGASSHGSGKPIVRPTAPSTAMGTAQLSAALSRHMAKAVSVSKVAPAPHFLSIATDKSSVGGLPLLTTFIQFGGSSAVFPALCQALGVGVSRQSLETSHLVIVFRV